MRPCRVRVISARAILVGALVAATSSALTCGQRYPQIRASGIVHGQRIDTYVDSELAAEYLAHLSTEGAQGSRAPYEAPTQLPPCSQASLGRDALRALSVSTSIDVASLYAAHCLIEANRALHHTFEQLFADVAALPEPAMARRAGLLSALDGLAVLVVPGWDYVRSGATTGGDLARQLELLAELGVPHTRVAIDPTGEVRENARVIGAEITRMSRLHDGLIVASASSGGPAVALALGDRALPSARRSVRAWLNLGGILGGVPLIDAYGKRLRYPVLRGFAALSGWPMESVASMSADASRRRLDTLELPRDITVVNYIGVPMSGDISRRAQFFYGTLRKYGPNDGITLVTDPILPGTQTLVHLGQDHFFADAPDLDTRALALLLLTAQAIERPP
jgi:hypothetical protein